VSRQNVFRGYDLKVGPTDGTGTRPDYLVNHGQKKWGAIRGKKLHRNREIVLNLMVGIVGAHGQLTQSAILRNPRTTYKRSKNVFAVTSIAFICARVCTQLLQPIAQSLIGSPGTLAPPSAFSLFNSAWESIFQMKVNFHFTTWKLCFLNISEYLARYGIQMNPSVTERSQHSENKPVLYMWGLLSTIIRGREGTGTP